MKPIKDEMMSTKLEKVICKYICPTNFLVNLRDLEACSKIEREKIVKISFSDRKIRSQVCSDVKNLSKKLDDLTNLDFSQEN